MDETGVRALLELVADDPAPPAQVDIAAARKRGRRRIRWHRAALGAAPLAAAAAVALVVSGVIPASLGLGRRGGLHPGPVTARSRFSPLVPDTAFGWLPAGFSAAAGTTMSVNGYDQTTPLSVTLDAGDPATGQLLTLTVSAAGACRFTGPQRDRVLAGGPPPSFASARYPHGLSCRDGVGHQTVTPLSVGAPDVHGGSAFYLPSGGLAWEYARDSWAQLAPSTVSTGGQGRERRSYEAAAGWDNGSGYGGFPATVQSATARGVLQKIAGRVSYGATTHILFPFQLAALPAGWAVSMVDFVPADGRLLGTFDLSAGPADAPAALGVQVQPAAAVPNCKIKSSGSHVIRVHGAAAWLQHSRLDLFRMVTVCNIAGLYVSVNVVASVPGSNRPVPGLASLGGVAAVARRMRLLGTDPAGWTAQPVR